MGTRRITVELDEETVRSLANFGRPEDVLRQLVAGEELFKRGTGARESLLSGGRGTTDRYLSDERTEVDRLLQRQRAVNEQLLTTSLRSQEVADAALIAQHRAEENARLLRELSELRELFIGVLGHDLRNPLNSIVLSAGTLLHHRAKLDPQDAVAAERIHASAQKISRMVTQLLDLTHIRLGGGFPIRRAEIDLRKVLSDCIGEFSAPIELTAEGSLHGWWDPDRIAQLVSNLLGNAIDYAAPGTPVTVRARDGAGAVRLEVTNEGPAIPDELLPHLFEPFRGKRGPDAESGHLGLGLFIAREIARGHGGDLSAHSAAGRTTFSVLLPSSAPK